MKHARKMVLVDINTLPPTKNDKTTDPLTNAISTLASSNEFNRAYYGPNTITITHLENDMRKILERRDLDPADKLKIYQDKLKRYLFLHRMSESSPQQQPPQIQTSPPQLGGWESAGEEEEEDLQATPAQQIEQLRKQVPITNSRKSKYRSRLPRSTPRKDTLRKKPKPKRLESYFDKWETPGRRKK